MEMNDNLHDSLVEAFPAAYTIKRAAGLSFAGKFIAAFVIIEFPIEGAVRFSRLLWDDKTQADRHAQRVANRYNSWIMKSAKPHQ